MGFVLEEPRGLHKNFGTVPAVRGVDVLVGPRRARRFARPERAGKTTTLLMVLGAIDPDEGPSRSPAIRLAQ